MGDVFLKKKVAGENASCYFFARLFSFQKQKLHLVKISTVEKILRGNQLMLFFFFRHVKANEAAALCR